MLPRLWSVLGLLVASTSALPIAMPDAAGQPGDFTTQAAAAAATTQRCGTRTRTETLPTSTDVGVPSATTSIIPDVTSSAGPEVTATIPAPILLADPIKSVAQPSASASAGGSYPAPKFEFGGATKMRGVNLGGWLVLEEWMTRDLFHNSGAWDQMSYDGQAQNNPQLRERLRNHWATFITPDDIQQISDAGLNAVRIPVGYWSVLGGGISGETYIAGALDYLNPVVEKCAQLGISVVIVLHGLPGSQNGQDNSGQSMGSTYQWFGNEYYKSKSVEAATRLVDLYGNGKYGGIVQSIALINEPKPRSDDDDIAFQKDFFRQAYDAIRANDPTMNVQYADGWRFPTQDSTWGGFANGQTSVSMDTHIYSLFHWETSGLGYNALLRWFCSRVDDVRSADANIPTIVGEWTAAVSMNCNDGDCSYWPDDRYYQHLARSFEAQTYVYEQGSGWVYWNWKLDRDDAWSFSTGIKQGWIPKDLSSKPHGTPCQFW